MNCPKCGIEIKDHPANACLDALFAEKVMGWKKKLWINNEECSEVLIEKVQMWWDENKDMPKIEIWRYNPSANISHAMKGVEGHKNISFFFDWFPKEEIWRVVCQKYVTGPMAEAKGIDALAFAITRALILWAMEGK